MSVIPRLSRVLLGALFVVIPAGGLTATADEPDPAMPTNHTEWLDRLFAADVTPQAGLTKITTSGSNSCGIEESQTVACWGGLYDDGFLPQPNNAFIEHEESSSGGCGIKPDHRIACTSGSPSDLPDGQIDVAAGGGLCPRGDWVPALLG